jgi:hypothetical protein
MIQTKNVRKYERLAQAEGNTNEIKQSEVKYLEKVEGGV